MQNGKLITNYTDYTTITNITELVTPPQKCKIKSKDHQRTAKYAV